MNVMHRELSSMATQMSVAARDSRTRSMLTELSDRYQRTPDQEVESKELYKQAFRMMDFGRDFGEKVLLGRAVMQFMSQRAACQVAGSFCLQAGAAVQQYDAEYGIYRAALQQPEAFESNQVAKLGLEMMSACERFPIDHAKVGELACRALSDQPAAAQALKEATYNRTHNQDGRLYRAALEGLASSPLASAEQAPAPNAPTTFLSRLDRVSGVQKTYETMQELLQEAAQKPELASASKIGLEMLEKGNDFRVCLLAGRTILEDIDQGQTDLLGTMNRVVQSLSLYPNSPIDKGELAGMALAQFKGKLEHEPMASVASAAASQTTTYLAQLAVCKTALECLAESPRPSPSVMAGRLVDAAAAINAKSASRAGQAAVQAYAALYDTPEVAQIQTRLQAELDQSHDYKDDLPILRRALQGLTELPAPAQGSLLAMAKAASGVGTETSSIGEQNGAMVVGGVRLKVKKRAWESEDAPKS